MRQFYFTLKLFLCLALASCGSNYTTSKENLVVDKADSITPSERLADVIQQTADTIETIRYNKSWEGVWMNQLGEKMALKQGNLTDFFRGIKIQIKNNKIETYYFESADFPFDTSIYSPEGYKVKNSTYYPTSYLLDFIDEDRILGFLRNKELGEIQKKYELYVKMEVINKTEYLVFTITYSDTIKKITRFIRHHSVNDFIVGSYQDQRGRKAIFNTQNNCNWLDYKSYMITTSLITKSEGKNILFLSKLSVDSMYSIRYLDSAVTDIFVMNLLPNKKLNLHKIKPPSTVDIVYVRGYPDALIDLTMDSLVFDLSQAQ